MPPFEVAMFPPVKLVLPISSKKMSSVAIWEVCLGLDFNRNRSNEMSVLLLLPLDKLHLSIIHASFPLSVFLLHRAIELCVFFL